MRPTELLPLACSALLLGSTAAHAQESSAQCAAPVAPTGELAASSKTAKQVAAGDGRTSKPAHLAIGVPSELRLHPSSAITYPAMPMKAGEEGSFGGMASFRVKTAGTYRVALSGPAWIDVASGTSTIASSTHSHGPECSGIRKMVDFKLASGSYTLQLSGSPASSATVLIARVN